METATLSIIDQIPQKYVDTFRMEVVNGDLQFKRTCINLDLITGIEKYNSFITINAGNATIYLYESGDKGIVIT